MAGASCWAAGALAGARTGVVSAAVLACGGLGLMIRATLKNTGASTSAASEGRTLSALPLRALQ